MNENEAYRNQVGKVRCSTSCLTLLLPLTSFLSLKHVFVIIILVAVHVFAFRERDQGERCAFDEDALSLLH